MDISIRKHVISNFKGVSKDEIKDSIDESVKEKDELILPGFGVFFELLWLNSTPELQNKILNTIKKAISEK